MINQKWNTSMSSGKHGLASGKEKFNRQTDTLIKGTKTFVHASLIYNYHTEFWQRKVLQANWHFNNRDKKLLCMHPWFTIIILSSGEEWQKDVLSLCRLLPGRGGCSSRSRSSRADPWRARSFLAGNWTQK